VDEEGGREGAAGKDEDEKEKPESRCDNEEGAKVELNCDDESDAATFDAVVFDLLNEVVLEAKEEVDEETPLFGNARGMALSFLRGGASVEDNDVEAREDSGDVSARGCCEADIDEEDVNPDFFGCTEEEEGGDGVLLESFGFDLFDASLLLVVLAELLP